MKITTQALLFDNDGTLVSSMDSVVRCWSRWAREERVTAEAFAAVQLHGRTAVAIIRDLLPEERVAAAVRRIEELELADADGVVVLPGTLALLGSLPAGRWAVVTSATGRLGAARLAAAAIDPPLLISADDVTNGKPDPEPFLLAARKLGVRPEDCTVFEDAPAGLTAGRAAGMRTVALATTHAVEELAADVVVRDLSAVSVQVTDAGLEITTAG
ncbi:HAD-IA family hydrolase [Streptomyces sp. So13.3]|uniref:HAD-IA family hydrolase n=1 Tax=Streptomyces TaxID=1883 RepID=UPI0011069AB8|nr:MULTISPECIES: HAD-IA family hydrolase [Streptomyces]MCZ4097557.1 HAD-IA family hydrolase [Streptomyces sp. H39-C1]QNA72455.1 HAD-IA family hydrolase [Streptomyces sp. So13.3]